MAKIQRVFQASNTSRVQLLPYRKHTISYL